MPTIAKPISKGSLNERKAFQIIVLTKAQRKELYSYLGEDEELGKRVRAKTGLVNELQKVLGQHFMAVISLDKQPVRPSNQRASISVVNRLANQLHDALEDMDVYSKSTLRYRRYYDLLDNLNDLNRRCDEALNSLNDKSSKGNITNKAIRVTICYLSDIFSKYNIHKCWMPKKHKNELYEYRKSVLENQKRFVKRSLHFADIQHPPSIDKYIRLEK